LTQQSIKKIARNALIVLIMTGLIAYVIYHCLQYFKDPVQVTAAVRQSEPMTRELTAYVFRDEQALSSGHGGALQELYEDGDHVAIDSEVARVYVSENGMELYEKLEKTDEEIAFIEQCLEAADRHASELIDLNETISRKHGEVMEAMSRTDGERVRILSDELLLLLSQRQVMTGELTDLPVRLAALKAERDELRRAYGDTYESITVDRSGYYYRETDGYEGIFSNEAARLLTLEGFDELIRSVPRATEKDAGKLIGDFVWYAAIPMSYRDAQMLTEGYVYSLTWEDGTVVDMELDRMLSDPQADRCVLVMKTGHMPQGFSFARVQTVSFAVGQTSGLRVPENALLTGKDGEMGVYILDVARVCYCSVEVIWHGNGYVLVRESDRTEEGHERDLGYQELIITRTDEELYDGKLLY
jgi:hypothetical protein